MASDYEAVSYAEVVPLPKTRSFRWSRVVPLALIVPIVAVFATPAFAFALLAAVLVAPVLVTAAIAVAARQEHGA
jgi:hypothetical protein